MQQQDLNALLAQLTASLADPLSSDDKIIQSLPQNTASLFATDINAAVAASPAAPTNPVVAKPVAANPVVVNPVARLRTDPIIINPVVSRMPVANKKIELLKTDTPVSGRLLQQGPDIFRTVSKSAPVVTRTGSTPIAFSKGSGVGNMIDVQNASAGLRKWFDTIQVSQFISVFLSADTVNPALLLSVQTNIIIQPLKQTSLPISKGSVWILSKLLNASAPAGQYTGLTVGGGSLSFDKVSPITKNVIAMAAGTLCTVQLDLQQPVDTTVYTQKSGADARNAAVVLPAKFIFSFSTPAAKILSVADASWKLYGSNNTFHYDATQSTLYNAALNSVLIPCTLIPQSFTVSKCESPFLTIEGTASTGEGYWELPVAAINIASPGTASGTGALGVLCGPGLKIKWLGLNGGSVQLKLPYISAAPGVVGIVDFFAANRYGKQNYNLWSNEKTGLVSALATHYSDQFAVSYISMGAGEEFLGTVAAFTAHVDRPVRVDASPVKIHGTAGLVFQQYTDAAEFVYLVDINLIAENFPPVKGVPVTDVPQEAIALTNALLTITPATGILLIGQLDTLTTFKKAYMLLSFGLFNLTPALPDPYASTFSNPRLKRASAAGAATDVLQRTIPISSVHELLLGLVSWPVTTAPPTPPPAQPAKVAFAILPLSVLSSAAKMQSQDAAPPPPPPPPPPPVAGLRVAAVITPDPETTWGNTVRPYGNFDLAMLDVSTNADLMGVSFSTMNIEAREGDNKYIITPVNNAGDPNIIQIRGMNLVTPGKFIRAFTVPEITWEPTANLTPPANKSGDPDPPLGWLLFGNDGGPSQIFNNSPDVVAIAPIEVSKFIVRSYKDSAVSKQKLITASVFTLPFGLRSFAIFNNQGPFPAGYVPAQLDIVPQKFDLTPKVPGNPDQKIVTGGLQIIAIGKNDPKVLSGTSFQGATIQLRNLFDQNGNVTKTSILGPSVDTIFNKQFQPIPAGSAVQIHEVGVPLERIDFSGYGASTFSNWIDPTAAIAATSQAKFDVFVGRTSLEIIQVKSIVYPWGIHVVRTITMYRAASAIIYRVDSGWRAETDGVYDFSYKDSAGTSIANPYTFHPGIVKGVFEVKNIIENDLPVFTAKWNRKTGELYIEQESQIQQPAAPGIVEDVILQPIYFDAEVLIDNVIQGATKGKVPSKKMVGYVQLSPRGEPLSPDLFAQLLSSQSGSLGGPVDCIVDIGKSGQHMRLHKVDVSNGVAANGKDPVFTGTARGTVVLPKDGSWSIVNHHEADNSVTAVGNNASVPLIRRGALVNGKSDYPAEQLRLANPMDILKPADTSTINYGLLQNTGTQKVLFQLPSYTLGVTRLQSLGNKFPTAKFADAYHLLKSTGIFPDPTSMPVMDMSNHLIDITKEGYKLLDKLGAAAKLQQKLPSPWYFVDTPDVKLYIEYNISAPNLNFDIDSAAEKWMASTKAITLNIDLGPFKKMVYITGDLDSGSGAHTAFNTPKMEFGPDLKPIVEILEVLESLSVDDNYADILKKAMSIAMGNSGDNYEYKFHADKEIPVLKFPPGELDGPTTPLRLTAGLKVGAYFNETLSITSDPSNLIPSAGAYFEFDAGLQVMCVSVGVGTIYAVGQVTLKLSADIKTGPSLYMKFGFGAEIMVGLPVVGNASVTIMAGIEITLSSAELSIGASLSFKGNADLLGGLVSITIYIEASGTIQKKLTGPDANKTNMIAQVTFAIDISIFLIINIDFSTSWEETKQIA